MVPQKVFGWWASTDTRIGPYTITPLQPITDMQLYNAYKLKAVFESWGVGWTLSAICGTIGNFLHECTLSPARVEATHVGTDWPYPITDLSEVPNSRMIDFYDHSNPPSGGYAMGLAQWDGHNNPGTIPYGQKLVSYAIRNNMDWYNGDLQCMRLRAEYDNDLQFEHREVFGVVWDWYSYVVNTRTPEVSADIWRQCYERPGGGFPETEGNARYLYDYFTLHPDPPVKLSPFMYGILTKKKGLTKHEWKFF